MLRIGHAAKFLDFVQPAGEKMIDVPFDAEPRDCLVVRAKRKVGSDAGRALSQLGAPLTRR